MYCGGGGGRREAMSNREATRKARWCGATQESLSRGEEDGREREARRMWQHCECASEEEVFESCKTSNVKNMAYHHNHVSACKREKKLLL